jgi:hypothetical protein
MGCTLQNVKYHAGHLRPKIAEKRATILHNEDAGIDLALREIDGRVTELIELYRPIRADLLDNGIYGVDTRMSATGKTIDVPAFKGAQLTQARGLLDDIAKELGARKVKTEVTGKDGESIEYTISFDRAADTDEAHLLPPSVDVREAT